MKRYFSEYDMTVYEEVDLPFNNAVQVVSSQIPGLAESYSKIVDSMQKVYQPLDFCLDEGVCVCFKQSPEDKYYIKQIYEDRLNVYVQLFGTDSSLVFPKFVQGLDMPHDQVILTPALENAEGTNVFGPSNKYSRPGYDITALVGNEPYIDFKTKDFELRLPGYVTYATDYAIETVSTGAIHRVWVSNNHTFNKVMSILPETIDVFLDDTEKLYISGLPLDSSYHAYKVVDYKALQPSSIELYCENGFTPTRIPLMLSDAALEVQGELWRKHKFKLPKANIDFMEVLL